ncbi:hypothetical protein FD754_000021, partial [Muntiacus muntjak]
YNKVYKNLKEFSQNGEDFCKQITSILQQRDLQKRLVILSREPISSLKYCMCAVRAKMPELIASCVSRDTWVAKIPPFMVLSLHRAEYRI